MNFFSNTTWKKNYHCRTLATKRCLVALGFKVTKQREYQSPQTYPKQPNLGFYLCWPYIDLGCRYFNMTLSNINIQTNTQTCDNLVFSPLLLPVQGLDTLR
jgi:hypothetical protein